ncbi:prokaryotic-type carbonic anhydrases signature 1 [Lucifera butyrica]|uniref:carbonic anhydrase n=1 Tax=Lucifera butyrica TaxID=1351585 RepID=A0A498R9I3_9FIRM|nr:carbonic anhydrase [Lucifera butyrica]VBB09366.1 prokaryotic-type carbonic anhydrases signature 1 [Lucifera butyrica]
MIAEHALRRLIEGNERYIIGQCAIIDVSMERRKELTEGQQPFAILIGCSDSRVPPEIIFGQGLGDLFVVRTAGGVVDDLVLGSVEYAVSHFGVELIVVLGHEDCGAVKAAVEGNHESGGIAFIMEAIEPAVERAKMQVGNLLDNAIKANIDLNIQRVRSSPAIREAMRKDCLKIVGAFYDIYDGLVQFLI